MQRSTLKWEHVRVGEAFFFFFNRPVSEQGKEVGDEARRVQEATAGENYTSYLLLHNKSPQNRVA